MNTSFLEDESLTDNMEDKLATKVLLWLEYLSQNKPDKLKKHLDFVRLLNNRKRHQSDNREERVLINVFETLIDILEPKNTALLFAAEDILNTGENHESQEEIFS